MPYYINLQRYCIKTDFPHRLTFFTMFRVLCNLFWRDIEDIAMKIRYLCKILE